MSLIARVVPVLLVVGLASIASAQSHDGSDKPVTVTLSPVQRAQIANYQKAAQDLAKEQQVYITAIVSGVVDPAKIPTWSMRLTDSSIVLTPPPKPKADSTPSRPVAKPERKPSAP